VACAHLASARGPLGVTMRTKRLAAVRPASARSNGPTAKATRGSSAAAASARTRRPSSPRRPRRSSSGGVAQRGDAPWNSQSELPGHLERRLVGSRGRRGARRWARVREGRNQSPPSSCRRGRLLEVLEISPRYSTESVGAPFASGGPRKRTSKTPGGRRRPHQYADPGPSSKAWEPVGTTRRGAATVVSPVALRPHDLGRRGDARGRLSIFAWNASLGSTGATRAADSAACTRLSQVARRNRRLEPQARRAGTTTAPRGEDGTAASSGGARRRRLTVNRRAGGTCGYY